MNAEQIIEYIDKLESDRSNFENTWQQCADYGMPNANQITRKDAKGALKPDLFDTTAEESIIQFSSGLYSFLFPADAKAFMLKISDPAIADDDEVKNWLSEVTRIVHQHLVNSNFRQAFFQFLKSLGCFGNAVLYIVKGEKKPLNFVCRHIANIYIVEDYESNVEMVFYTFEYTARKAIQAYGKNLRKEILDAEKNDPLKTFPFVQAVYPREKFNPESRDPLLMEYASVHVDRQAKKKVLESGHPEMPFMVDRFDKDPNEDYGRGPTEKKLPDIKMLNEMKRIRIKGWDKMVDPQVIVPDDGSIHPLTSKPGGVIYKRAGGDSPEWFEYKGNMQGFDEAIAAVRSEVRVGYFLDLFDALIDRQNMTATEVIERAQQKLRLSVPMVGQRQSDLFNPMIHRVIGILGRAELLPPIPEILVGVDYEIEYLGRIALALQTLESEGFLKTLSDFLPLAEAGFADFLDNFDIDLAARGTARNNGTNATWIKSVKQRDNERNARAQAQQQQALLEQAGDLSKAAKNLNVPVEDNSMLQEVANAV